MKKDKVGKLHTRLRWIVVGAVFLTALLTIIQRFLQG